MSFEVNDFGIPINPKVKKDIKNIKSQLGEIVKQVVESPNLLSPSYSVVNGTIDTTDGLKITKTNLTLFSWAYVGSDVNNYGIEISMSEFLKSRWVVLAATPTTAYLYGVLNDGIASEKGKIVSVNSSNSSITIIRDTQTGLIDTSNFNTIKLVNNGSSISIYIKVDSNDFTLLETISNSVSIDWNNIHFGLLLLTNNQSVNCLGTYDYNKATQVQYVDATKVIKSDNTLLEDNLNKLSVNGINYVGKTQPYKTVFYDDFGSLKSTWVSTHTDGTAGEVWTVGSNQLSSPVAITKDTLLLNEDALLSDGKISMVFENPNPSLTTTSWVGIALRGKSKSNVLGAIIHNYASGNTGIASLYKMENGTNTKLTDIAIDASEFVQNRPLNVEVEIMGINIKVRINGKKYIDFSSVNIASYANGICGIMASGVETSVKNFSNFTVMEKIFDMVPYNTANILCMGDSITAGVGVTQAYPALMSNLITSNWKDGIVVTNGGISGDTTAQMLSRIITYLSNGVKYDVVIIHGGTNDSRIDLNIPMDTAITNITEMIKRIKTHGAIPLVCAISPINKTISTTTYDINSYNYIVRLNARIKQLCAKEKIRCVDIYGAFNNDVTLLQSDKLHPNETGAQLIAQTIFNTMTNQF